MLVTSRMWQFTRWMPVAGGGPLPAEARAGEERRGSRNPLQATVARRRLRSVRPFSARPTQRWPCLIRSGRAAEGEVPAAVEAVVVAGAEALVEEVVPVVEVQEGAVRVALVEVARVVAVVKTAPAGARAEEAAPAAAETILALTSTITILPTTSRGPSCRHFHLPPPPTSHFRLRLPKKQAVSSVTK